MISDALINEEISALAGLMDIEQFPAKICLKLADTTPLCELCNSVSRPPGFTE